MLSIVGHFDDGVYGVRLPSSSGLMLVELRIAIDLQAQWQVGIWVTRVRGLTVPSHHAKVIEICHELTPLPA